MRYFLSLSRKRSGTVSSTCCCWGLFVCVVVVGYLGMYLYMGGCDVYTAQPPYRHSHQTHPNPSTYLQVVVEVVHHHVHLIEAAADHHLAHPDNIRVAEREQDVDLTERVDREALLAGVGVELHLCFFGVCVGGVWMVLGVGWVYMRVCVYVGRAGPVTRVYIHIYIYKDQPVQ